LAGAEAEAEAAAEDLLAEATAEDEDLAAEEAAAEDAAAEDFAEDVTTALEVVEATTALVEVVGTAVQGLWQPLLYLLVVFGPATVVETPNLFTRDETWFHDMPWGGLKP